MAFKFSVGQAVEYRPAQQQPGMFFIVRHLPQEDGDSDRKYRIRSLKEGFERTVSDSIYSRPTCQRGPTPSLFNHRRLVVTASRLSPPLHVQLMRRGTL